MNWKKIPSKVAGMMLSGFEKKVPHVESKKLCPICKIKCRYLEPGITHMGKTPKKRVVCDKCGLRGWEEMELCDEQNTPPAAE